MGTGTQSTLPVPSQGSQALLQADPTHPEGFFLQVGIGELEDHSKVDGLGAHPSWLLVEIHLLENLQKKRGECKGDHSTKEPPNNNQSMQVVAEPRRQGRNPNGETFLNTPHPSCGWERC